MGEPEIESCPICHEPLEAGFLSFLCYLKWCGTEPSSWHGLQGELLAGRNWWMRNRSTRAARCTKCNLVLFSGDYPQGQ